jgi:hypothetical protein
MIRESKYTFLYKSADGNLMRPESFLNINKGRTLSASQLGALGITKVKNESRKHQATSSKLQAASVKLTQRQTKNNE